MEGYDGPPIDIDWWRRWVRGQNGPQPVADAEHLDALYAGFMASVWGGGTETFDFRLGEFLDSQGLRPEGAAAAELLAASLWKRYEVTQRGRRLYTKPPPPRPDPSP